MRQWCLAVNINNNELFFGICLEYLLIRIDKIYILKKGIYIYNYYVQFVNNRDFCNDISLMYTSTHF